GAPPGAAARARPPPPRPGAPPPPAGPPPPAPAPGSAPYSVAPAGREGAAEAAASGLADAAGADGRGPGETAGSGGPAVPVRPSPQLLDRLVDEVAARRAKRRRRGRFLAAAAAVLIVGGPTAAVVATSGDHASTTRRAADANSESAHFRSLATKYSATDAATGVSATIAVQDKPWGTDAVMELRNVQGPLKCRLVAVSKSGERQTMTSWAVPDQGYGVPGSPHSATRQPLYVQGGTAVRPKDIDHFDVTTFDGKRLVRVPA
ncbi:RNA polymerase subunit sigma, partial [Streptomyces sp. 8L]|uniref:RNA polymerase subunit sigma n=1 Tax=Streptomyces sp. 8L TaxID=2877242 RepID=UPI001CD2FE75